MSKRKPLDRVTGGVLGVLNKNIISHPCVLHDVLLGDGLLPEHVDVAELVLDQLRKFIHKEF